MSQEIMVSHNVNVIQYFKNKFELLFHYRTSIFLMLLKKAIQMKSKQLLSLVQTLVLVIQ